MTELTAVPVKEYKDRFALTAFVETGCYHGDGLVEARRVGFEFLVSCDLQADAVSQSRQRVPEALIAQNESVQFLLDVCGALLEPTLFWLDAHFPQMHGGVDEPHTKMPLLEELAMIKQFKRGYERDVIICDDIHVIADPNNPTYKREKIPLDVADYYYVEADWNALTAMLSDTHHFVAMDSERGGVGIFYPRLRILTIDTVQGVGDIFWVYQKLSPHCDLINFNLLITAPDPVQERAKPFIDLLPKVGAVVFKQVPGDEYVRAARCRPLIHETTDGCVYAVNNYLESGTRLDDIDGDVEWAVQFNVSPLRVREGRYVCMYVSGSPRHYHDKFTPVDWAELFVKLNIPDDLVLVGAEYDRWMLDEVGAELTKRAVAFETCIAQPAETIIRLLRDARLMIGFQSGLNVIANNYGVPTIMVDFNHLRPMARTWCRPGTPFAGYVFEDGVNAVVEGSKTLVREAMK